MLQNEQIYAMLKLQASMNAKVNPLWLTAGYSFLRAVVVEGAEAMEHHGWKWWKAQKCDLPQLQMELVDIWHFALSHFVIRADGDLDNAAGLIMLNSKAQDVATFDGVSSEFSVMGVIEKLELMIGLAVARKFHIQLFASLLSDCQMTWDELYRKYVGKNVLNFFRQDNGYKQGTYVKVWDGREDNEHLVEVLSVIDASDVRFAERIYEALNQRYALVAA